jgi:hypothetical protein
MFYVGIIVILENVVGRMIDLFAVQNCGPRKSVNCAPWRNLVSVEEKITASIKNTVDLGWIQSSGWSLHHQEVVDDIAWSVNRISIPW